MENDGEWDTEVVFEDLKCNGPTLHFVGSNKTSDFFSPLLYLKSEENYTLPVALQLMQQMDKTNWPLLMAGAVFMTTPVVIVFLALQRYFWPDDSKGEREALVTE